MRFPLLLLPWLLLLPVTLTVHRPGRHARGVRSAAPASPSSAKARPRPYVPAPVPRIPDYAGFAAVAERHASRWEVTFAGDPLPYRARHRADGHRVACDDLEVFGLVLATGARPSVVRPYAAARVRTEAAR
ncbi:hypothetical protein HDA32_005981 [Spinactinospora alkalitolerans]|uniref:Uncharacterized protein n=1 Tax=Spinactinospora alkalitolerans TaxID=687207 RepID=A0A852U3U6_9ACTN|nr:hypothetical protein [Spinactinospora alkalitolerans]NYE50861.1 hypothetical protein [Spinactinospora alkalitolerans]